MLTVFLPGIGEKPKPPDQKELRKIFHFYFGSIYDAISPLDEQVLKKRYEKAYKCLVAFCANGSKIEPMPTPPEELSEFTEDCLADVEASVGMFVLALTACVRKLTMVLLY